MWKEAELKVAAGQLVLLRLQELVQQSGHEPPQLLLQPGHVAAAQRPWVRPRPLGQGAAVGVALTVEASTLLPADLFPGAAQYSA